MKIWLDTINPIVIQSAIKMGILEGITTNPTIITHSEKSLKDVLISLLHLQEGPVTAQVVAATANEMVQQGINLFTFSNRIIVKVPATKEGMEAIHLLSRQGIPTMATIVYSSQQALLAALAGANYVAPYLSRLEMAGGNPTQLLESTQQIFNNYHLKTKILAASLSSVQQIMKCAELGIHAITLKEDLFDQFLENQPLTLQSNAIFIQNWKSREAFNYDIF